MKGMILDNANNEVPITLYLGWHFRISGKWSRRILWINRIFHNCCFFIVFAATMIPIGDNVEAAFALKRLARNELIYIAVIFGGGFLFDIIYHIVLKK